MTLILYTYTDSGKSRVPHLMKDPSFEVHVHRVFSDQGYNNTLPSIIAEHWAKGRTLINIEQDFVPTLAGVRELRDCPELVCTVLEYEGLIKFNARAQSIFLPDDYLSYRVPIPYHVHTPAY